MARTRSAPPLRTGPFKGVYATRDPYDARPEFLVDAKNGYVADPVNRSGFTGRGGFRLLNVGSPLVSQATPFRGQAVYTHTQLDGSTINFIAMAGKVFRVSADLSGYTDVTPAGITVDGAITTRVYFASLIGTLMVTDGVNRPWVASDLTSTPITGTYIDYDGTGVSWSIFGAPKVYGGSAFGILNQVNGISRRADISWCEPGQLSVGWQQANYDDNWTLSQNEAGLLYALEATNLALYYFRSTSIGSVSGTVGPNLASTATDDAIAFNIGSQAASTVQKFGTGFFFLDALGRPYWYEPGIPPDPIWKQMRQFVEAGTTNFPSITATVATATIVPTLNLYVVAIYSPTPSIEAQPVEFHVFDAITRLYQGRWDVAQGIGIDCVGTVLDSAGRSTLIVLGGVTAGSRTNGYVWSFSAIESPADDLTTEAGVFLTTEAGVQLTTEGQSAVMTDNGVVPDVYVTTDRLGYADDTVWNIDRVTIIALNDLPLRVTITSSGVSSVVEGVPQPSASNDGTYRLVCGCDVFGRGPMVTVSPAATTAPFLIESVALTGVPSTAGPEDA